MSIQGYTPVEQDRFGGLQTAQGDQTKVPRGFSPTNQNVRFYPGGRVATREGLSTQATISGTSDILGIKEYIDLAYTRRLIVLLDDGTLRYESGAFAFTTIATNVVSAGVAPLLRLASVSQFGKEWVCFGATSLYGSNPAKVFYNDPGGDFFFDPVAPEGPANAPTAATSATAGNVSVGTHKFRVFYKTRSGYWSQLGPEVSLTVSTASRSVDIAQIAKGPAYVTGRVIAATPAFSNTFYFLSGTAMEINDNTTTSVTIDFTDANLTNGTVVTHPTDVDQDLFRQITINAPGAVQSYSGRNAYWGLRHTYVRNGDNGPLNMRFQCGYGATGNANLPNGWTEKVAGESVASALTGSIYGEPVRITGAGTTTQKGCLENNGQVTKYLPTGVEAWCRIRVKRNATATSGILYAYMCPSATVGTTVTTTHGSFSIAGASTTEWGVFSFRLLTAAQNTGFDATTRFRISAGSSGANAMPLNGTLDIDYIEIYTPGYDGDVNTSMILWSKNGDPEAVDGLNGRMLVEPENGEPLTACFPMRGNYYMCKERSIFVTQDNGATEPVDWSVENVSRTIGTPSRDGAALGDGWAVIAARSGLYFFDGRTPIPISDEIAPTWARINFTNGQPGPAQKIATYVDTDKKRIYVVVPLDGATNPTHVIVLEYFGNTPVGDQDRNYSLWSAAGMTPTCIGASIRSDGTKMVLIGDNASRLLYVDPAATHDFTATAINSIYRTNFIRPGPYRSLLAKVVADIAGAGSLTVRSVGPDATTTKTLVPTQTLGATTNKDLEWKHQHIGEAIALEFQTNASDAYFQLSRLTTWWKTPAPSGATREHSA